jgi:phosphatidylinositol 4-kinase type 2
MPSGYQPLAQSIDEESDVGDSSLQGSSPAQPTRVQRARPSPIDLSKLDNAFKR